MFITILMGLALLTVFFLIFPIVMALMERIAWIPTWYVNMIMYYVGGDKTCAHKIEDFRRKS